MFPQGTYLTANRFSDTTGERKTRIRLRERPVAIGQGSRPVCSSSERTGLYPTRSRSS